MSMSTLQHCLLSFSLRQILTNAREKGVITAISVPGAMFGASTLSARMSACVNWALSLPALTLVEVGIKVARTISGH